MGSGRTLEELSSGEIANEAAIGGEKIVAGQVSEFAPLHIVEDAVGDLAAEFADREELQIDGAAAAIGVAGASDAGAYLGGDAELFVEFAGKGFFGALAGFHFTAGKLPLESHRLVGTALTDEHLAAAQDQGNDDQPHALAVVDPLRRFEILAGM